MQYMALAPGRLEMYLDMSLETLGYLVAMTLVVILFWWRALTHKGNVDRAEMALFTIIFMLSLTVAFSFWFVLKPSELAVVLTAQVFGIGTLLMSPAVGLIAMKFLRMR